MAFPVPNKLSHVHLVFTMGCVLAWGTAAVAQSSVVDATPAGQDPIAQSAAEADVAPVTSPDQSPRDRNPPPATMETADLNMPMGAPGWSFTQDAVLFGVFNHQGGPRGGEEFKVPNWWMGMLSRKIGRSQLTLNSMLSLDPATLSASGYREIFQIGEALHGKPLVDRQHPHDFFMQLAGVWRIPVAGRTGFTLAGGPSGEPALGPVTFMHRASASEMPLAPLSHHTFDSTHIAFGVVTAAVDHGPWVVEASAFNGREPDERRWDFDFNRLDSFSGRIWLRPSENWEFQVSSARLTHPEELDAGFLTRTTASGSWLKVSGRNFTAVTTVYGINATDEAQRQAGLVEATRQWGRTSLYTRAEVVDVETNLLLADVDASTLDHSRTDSVGALTLGGIHDVLWWRGIQGGIGAAVTYYEVPRALRATHGARPISYQVYFRLRPPAGAMGRMWNMRMSQPMMKGSEPAHQHHAGTN